MVWSLLLRSAVLLLLGSLAACAHRPASSPAPMPPTPTVLGRASVQALADLLRMEDNRQLDSARMTRLVHDPFPVVRARAALVLGRVPETGSSMLLLSMLHDPSPRVRADAAFALGLAPDASARVVRDLSAALVDPDSAVSSAAAFALGRIGTPVAAEAVLGVLQDVTARVDSATTTANARQTWLPTPAVVPAALLALARFPPTREGGQAASTLLEHPDAAVRWRAAYALLRRGGAAAVPALLAHMNDPAPLVRSLVARGLGAARADSAGLLVPARHALVSALDDPDAGTRIAAVQALGSYHAQDLAGPISALLRQPGSPAVAAANALGQLGGPAASAALEATAENDSLPRSLRAAALRALARIAPGPALQVAAVWERAPLWRVRYYAAQALGDVPWDSAVGPLRRLALDPDPRVAVEALNAARSSADTAASAEPLYVQELAAADPFVRAVAIQGLARRPSAAHFALLMAAYNRSQTDSVPDASLAAIQALAALAHQGVPVARTFFLRFSRSPDPLVRRSVALHLGKGSWGAVGPTAPPRPPGFYQDVVRHLVLPVLAGAAPPRAILETAGDTLVVELAAADAPLTVYNFMTLVEHGYYQGTPAQPLRWHRVVPDFVLQDGDPRGDGNGGPGYAIRDEINPLPYLTGTMGMALAGPDTGGSQFFITLSPQPHLDGGYTVFGRVVAGMSGAWRILQDDSIALIRVET